jgi:hypothetical protein
LLIILSRAINILLDAIKQNKHFPLSRNPLTTKTEQVFNTSSSGKYHTTTKSLGMKFVKAEVREVKIGRDDYTING